MPEKLEKLSESDLEKIRDWVNRQGGGPFCPGCKKENYIIMDEIIRIPTIAGKNMYPTLLVVCQTCGYLRFYSAIATGIDVDKYGG